MFDMSHAEFMQQQAAVIRNQAIHAARYRVDTTAVLEVLNFLIPQFPADGVVSNALTDALRSIEADIDKHMGH
jgi:hypothetical protein